MSGVRDQWEGKAVDHGGGVAPDRQSVNRKDVRWAVVQAIVVVEIQFHSDKAVVTVKP